LESFGFQFFVGDVKSGIGLGFFDPGPQPQGPIFVCFFKNKLGENSHL